MKCDNFPIHMNMAWIVYHQYDNVVPIYLITIKFSNVTNIYLEKMKLHVNSFPKFRILQVYN